jgi:hypothetical protein
MNLCWIALAAFIIQFNSNCLGTASLHNVSSKRTFFLFFPISVKTMEGKKKKKKMIGPESSSYRLTAIVSNPHAGGCRCCY